MMEKGYSKLAFSLSMLCNLIFSSDRGTELVKGRRGDIPNTGMDGRG